MNPQHSPDSETDRLPRNTTPTWEVELLISGVAVFAMLQLPDWLDGQMSALLPRFDANLRMPLQTLFIYATSASVILAATFSLHLLLRAHWIARVGMHSIYPDGVRWSRLRSGPIVREVEMRLAGDPLAAIERADNRATRVFAIGVSLASTLLALVLAIGLVFPPVWLLTHWLAPRVRGDMVFLAIGALFLVPWIVLLWMDRLFGARIAPNGLLWRLLRPVFYGYAAIGLGKGSSVLGLMGSHHGERRMHAITTLSMLACMFMVFATLMLQHNLGSIGTYALFPDLRPTDARQLDGAHYDDQRDPLHDRPRPFIPSMVVKGDYLPLVVPYRPERDADAQRRHCPQAMKIADKAARADALLQCLTELHPLALDGTPIKDLRYDVGQDPRTDRPALIAMLDIRALAPGRHILTVGSTPDTQHDETLGPVMVVRVGTPPRDARDPALDQIAFWR